MNEDKKTAQIESSETKFGRFLLGNSEKTFFQGKSQGTKSQMNGDQIKEEPSDEIESFLDSISEASDRSKKETKSTRPKQLSKKSTVTFENDRGHGYQKKLTVGRIKIKPLEKQNKEITIADEDL